ncbi:hypothetical protein PpBr36_05458 [Pyricularia pennisetigena]|uniref:hypothetical protein n=1 Tax=Pyricularia pennisetigena TaxID=1578925 RepID=UPI00114E3111|nr:hypothetical protein PpBr36_05458 [Pyricularia pennisetigena]TLS26670.1 hypothetical protein PpBr36_05458 [Pyricularia pennisetigena]
MSTRAAALVVLAGFATLVSGYQSAGEGDQFESRGYIIEFSESHGLDARDEILSSLPDLNVTKTFASAVFTGASVEATLQDIDALRLRPGISNVWHNEEVHLLAPVVGPRQAAAAPNETAHAVHWATGVEQLHAQGVLGEGVKVGVVDTGVQYTHVALGGGLGPGFKVAGGWDFVGDGGWPAAGAPKAPDADPMDHQGHGTHVAGILLGEAASGWRGVAPRATMHSYKVFGRSSGSTTTETIIDAFLRAYDDGMDVITASIGGRGGFAENAWAVVADRIAAEGVVVTIGAGNSGEGGPYYASSGSSGQHVLAVASAEVKKGTAAAGADKIQPSYFTSWGGLYDLSVKPDIAAPGTDIYSTYIGDGNDVFSLLSGTSMATPYVAGVAALYISANGGRSIHGKGFAKQLAMDIMATGSPLPWLRYSDRTAVPSSTAPVHQVGGGLVNATAAIRSKMQLELKRFALNDTLHFRGTQVLRLTNRGATAESYTFGHEDWAGFDMLLVNPADTAETPRIRSGREMEPLQLSPGVRVPGAVELQPGQSTDVEFSFTLPQVADETTLPVYSGRVTVKAGGGESAAVVYQGLAFNLGEQMRNPYAGTYPWLRSTLAYSNKTTYVKEKDSMNTADPKAAPRFSFNLSAAAQDFPKIFMKLKWGTREVRWDPVDTARPLIGALPGASGLGMLGLRLNPD